MRKIIVFIMIAVMVLACSLFYAACESEKVLHDNSGEAGGSVSTANGADGSDKTERRGTFCSVKEAYEGGYLNKNELTAIAYFHNNDIFQTMPSSTEAGLKEAFAKQKVEDRVEGVDVYGTSENVVIREYLGRFNDCFAVMIGYNGWGYGMALWSDTIGGVTINYTDGQEISIFVIPDKEHSRYDYEDYGEDTTYTIVDINDDFTDDCIMVVIKKNASEINKTFKAEDFKHDNIESVEDLFYFENPETAHVNEDNFRQILKLNLKEKTKEKVAEAVYAVQQISFVFSAEPNVSYSIA